MHTYTAIARVSYWHSPTEKRTINTVLTVQAPSKRVAKAILDNYGHHYKGLARIG